MCIKLVIDTSATERNNPEDPNPQHLTCSKSGMNPVPLNARVQHNKCLRHLQPHRIFLVQLPVRAQLGLIANVPVKVTDVWVLW